MSDTVFQLLKYWRWYREEKPNGTIEGFMNYLCDQEDKGGGL